MLSGGYTKKDDLSLYKKGDDREEVDHKTKKSRFYLEWLVRV